jgi:hypothetical protein
MSASNPDRAEITRRFERLMQRDCLRKILVPAGLFPLVVGVLLRISPFGGSLSNPAAIPKADPHAGLLLMQSLPSTIGATIGLCLVLLGALLLLLYWLMGRSSQDPGAEVGRGSSPNNSLERTRDR